MIGCDLVRLNQIVRALCRSGGWWCMHWVSCGHQSEGLIVGSHNLVRIQFDKTLSFKLSTSNLHLQTSHRVCVCAHCEALTSRIHVFSGTGTPRVSWHLHLVTELGPREPSYVHGKIVVKCPKI